MLLCTCCASYLLNLNLGCLRKKIFFGVNTDRARYGANIRYCTHPRNNEMGTITVSDKLGPSSKVSNVRYFQSVPSNEVTTFYAVLPTLPYQRHKKLFDLLLIRVEISKFWSREALNS